MRKKQRNKYKGCIFSHGNCELRARIARWRCSRDNTSQLSQMWRTRRSAFTAGLYCTVELAVMHRVIQTISPKPRCIYPLDRNRLPGKLTLCSELLSKVLSKGGWQFSTTRLGELPHPPWHAQPSLFETLTSGLLTRAHPFRWPGSSLSNLHRRDNAAIYRRTEGLLNSYHPRLFFFFF